jgi:hypothetical protein
MITYKKEKCRDALGAAEASAANQVEIINLQDELIEQLESDIDVAEASAANQVEIINLQDELIEQLESNERGLERKVRATEESLGTATVLLIRAGGADGCCGKFFALPGTTLKRCSLSESKCASDPQDTCCLAFSLQQPIVSALPCDAFFGGGCSGYLTD